MAWGLIDSFHGGQFFAGLLERGPCDMQDCEHYEECLNDPTRDKDMEVRCRECNDISAELLKVG